jgi:hypothetical protein
VDGCSAEFAQRSCWLTPSEAESLSTCANLGSAYAGGDVMAISGCLRNTRTTPTSRRLSLYFDKKHRSTILLGIRVEARARLAATTGALEANEH